MNRPIPTVTTLLPKQAEHNEPFITALSARIQAVVWAKLLSAESHRDKGPLNPFNYCSSICHSIPSFLCKVGDSEGDDLAKLTPSEGLMAVFAL